MNQIVTQGIILRRINYGEADRILTVLTPDQGKLSLVAKGARRIKSKLAGGIELFSISSITFIRGRGDLGTLISSRLETHYGNITKDITRVQFGYELIKMLDKTTEDDVEEEYFSVLTGAFVALNDVLIDTALIQAWFTAQLLRINGHLPNLASDVTERKFQADKRYNFDFDSMALAEHSAGVFDANAIKFMRLLFSETTPQVLTKVEGSAEHITRIRQLVTLWQQQYIF